MGGKRKFRNGLKALKEEKITSHKSGIGGEIVKSGQVHPDLSQQRRSPEGKEINLKRREVVRIKSDEEKKREVGEGMV